MGRAALKETLLGVRNEWLHDYQGAAIETNYKGGDNRRRRNAVTILWINKKSHKTNELNKDEKSGKR